MNSVRARIFVLALLTFLSSMIAFANHAYANIINGDISIVSELKTPLSEVEPDDLARVKKLCLPKLQEQISHAINPGKTVFSLIFIF